MLTGLEQIIDSSDFIRIFHFAADNSVPIASTAAIAYTDQADDKADAKGDEIDRKNDEEETCVGYTRSESKEGGPSRDGTLQDKIDNGQEHLDPAAERVLLRELPRVHALAHSKQNDLPDEPRDKHHP